MHKSRLAGFIIDCQSDDLQACGRFWGAALGMQARELPSDEADRYQRLVDPHIDLHMEVQTVDHPSRVHLDIETDDIEAEVTRLEKLGATRVAKVHTWVVMQAPTGHRFCVVRAASKNFDSEAHVWT
ncbi:MAG: VOC family protein [Proteobacteria bacterium]|nr:VOC family protein [Pseudomonadota bacterium]